MAKPLLRFTFSTLIMDLIAEILTMQMPLQHESARLGQYVSEMLIGIVLASLCAAIGGAVAFRLFPGTRQLSVRHLGWAALSFVIAAYVAAEFLAPAGIAVLAIVLIVIAFLVVMAAGRWMILRAQSSK